MGVGGSSSRGLTDRDEFLLRNFWFRDTDSSNANETCCHSKFLFKPRFFPIYLYFTLIAKHK